MLEDCDAAVWGCRVEMGGKYRHEGEKCRRDGGIVARRVNKGIPR
jgi:hypothetical protein